MLIKEEIYETVKACFQGSEGGHDWNHTMRVISNAQLIARGMKVNHEIVELASLFHDIADAKFYGGDETIGPKMAIRIMDQYDIEEYIKKEIIKIIENISFKNSLEGRKWSSKELEIVQDADRLDAIGAVGIARAFNYGGFKNRVFYDLEIPPLKQMNKEQYKTSTAPTINHFYEKLLKLKKAMNTKIGKAMAQERHDFMLTFLNQFYKETGITPLWHNDLE